jgi:hypothetical protein
MLPIETLKLRLIRLTNNHCILESELKKITYKFMQSKRIISKLKKRIQKLESDYNAL